MFAPTKFIFDACLKVGLKTSESVDIQAYTIISLKFYGWLTLIETGSETDHIHSTHSNGECECAIKTFEIGVILSVGID